MKENGFIRCLYGTYDTSPRLKKIDNDINRVINGEYKHPFVTYVFGENNYKMLTDKGLEVKLVDKNPMPFKLKDGGHTYRNKMELIKIAMEDYKELIYLDWDCYQMTQIPDNMWEELRQREFIQGCFQMYRRRQVSWRQDNQRVLLNGGLMYIGWGDIIKQACELYDKEFTDNASDEPAYSKLIDEINKGKGGFNREEYLKRYEIKFGVLYKNSIYTKEELDFKQVIFRHVQGRGK